jgi:excisionase family DNA binding protein
MLSSVTSLKPLPSHCSTLEAARVLGMAVRSVQLMVDRGELEAWKTPGGHRRILRSSIDAWQASRQGPALADTANVLRAAPAQPAPPPAPRPSVLLIEDSAHYQHLVTLLVKRQFPEVDLHVASNGIDGLVMYGQLRPDVLIIDILLPGIDGATLITNLQSRAHFDSNRLIVVTSLDETQREPYNYALQGVPVIHKPQVVAELPPLLAKSLAEAQLARA